MIVRAAIWLGSFLLGKGKGVVGGLATGALLAIAGLLVALFVRGCVADRALEDMRQERNDALTDLGECRAVNDANAAVIEDINEQAAADLAAAEAERLRAERAAAEVSDELEDADARHAKEIADLRAALAGDECGSSNAPAVVDGVWRNPPGNRPG